ncbi:sex peptide receptor [Culicoides brevitarsis]|uniref:sex peptide receptor n=1 Tax=Culicoides brevitarsis TaxID=469753 RepID=UPI00307BA3E5
MDNLTYFAMLIGNDDTKASLSSSNSINNNHIIPDQSVIPRNSTTSDDEAFLDDGNFSCLNFYNNMTYLNVSCESNVQISVIFYGYFFPILLLITVVANSLIVVVLSRRNMASPTNSVLMAMAICDLLTVLFPAPGILYMYTFGNHYKPIAPAAWCYLWNAFNEILPALYHTASIWLTLALAVQRYIYVCHPQVARVYCTLESTQRYIAYILVAAALHQSTRFFDRSYEVYPIEWNSNQVDVCHIETAKWIGDTISEDIYFTSYYLFRVIFVHLLPCFSLVILNIFLFKAMKQAQEKREKLFRENRKKECKKLRDANCTTLMLIVIVSAFLIVEIPLAVITALHIISSLYFEFLNYEIANLFILFANFSLVVSYPINFAIYCGMSRQFRETFKEIFLRGTKKTTCNSSRYSLVNGPKTVQTNETVL